MSGVAELVSVMMNSAERRMAVTAANLSNVSTPSFQARRVFSQIVDLREGVPVDTVSFARSGSARGLKATGNALDVAVNGNAVLMLRGESGYFPVNSVQLQRDRDGRLVDGMGRALQSIGGGDIVMGRGTPAILADGTIILDGQAVARIGLFRAGIAEAGDRGLPGLPDATENGSVAQGYVAPSNVDPAEEMVELTKASRFAETGARIFQIYDDLVGRATSKLGELGR